VADKIKINYGKDQEVEVPAWATEETAAQMAKWNEASAKALTNMVKGTRGGEKVAADNRKLFKEMRDNIVQDNQGAAETEKKKATYVAKMGDHVKKFGKSSTDAAKGFAEAFDKNSLSGIATAIAGVIGMGAAAGFAVSVLENFTKQVADLAIQDWDLVSV